MYVYKKNVIWANLLSNPLLFLVLWAENFEIYLATLFVQQMAEAAARYRTPVRQQQEALQRVKECPKAIYHLRKGSIRCRPNLALSKATALRS